MNPINFTRTASASRQQEVVRWYRFSAFVVCLVLFGACYILFPSITSLFSTHRALRATQQQIQSVPQALLTEQDMLKSSLERVKKKNDILKKWQDNPQLFSKEIDIILEALGEKTNLESIRIDATGITLDLLSASTQKVMDFLEKLAGHSHFSNVRLVSVHVTNALLPVHATVNATCKKV